MKMKQYDIDSTHQQDFSVTIARFNMQRWRPFAIAIIGIELALLVILVSSLSASTSFKYGWYSLMYALMIIATGLTCFLFYHFGRKLNHDSTKTKAINLIIIGYLSFFMTWGAIIALMDQQLYGNVFAFVVNMLVGSYMFLVDSRRIAVPQLISSLLLIIGLPFVQPSGNILIGDYVNLTIFIAFSWLISRTNYTNFVSDFLNQKDINEKKDLLAQINSDLLWEIKARKQIQKELEEANEQLTAISSLDPLTGIPNRRKLEESLTERWASAVKERTPITIMMIDIDLFKLYNDTYGHIAGDSCLQTVAGVLNESARDELDPVARYGGEEFLFALTGLEKNEAWQVGEKIRASIEALGLEHKSSSVSPYVTVSIGISWQVPTANDSIIESLAQADQAMYQAKHAGRNRVVMAE